MGARSGRRFAELAVRGVIPGRRGLSCGSRRARGPWHRSLIRPDPNERRASRLETWDFQAPDFHRGQGYGVAGVIPGCPPGITEYILTERLA